jgi:flagella basal body P-ring formation protein FlgA
MIARLAIAAGLLLYPATVYAQGVSDACAAIARSVAERMGTAAIVTACDAVATAGRWDDAVPDAAARVGEPSWFTLTTGHAVTRVKATVVVSAPHAASAALLTRGRVLGDGDVVAVEGPVTGARFARLPLAADVAGARLTRTVPQGGVVEATDVVIPPIVRAGERVVAVVRIGAVEVSAEMTAVDAGAVGDEIRIAHPDRKRVLRARIVGPGRVEVPYEK